METLELIANMLALIIGIGFELFVLALILCSIVCGIKAIIKETK